MKIQGVNDGGFATPKQLQGSASVAGVGSLGQGLENVGNSINRVADQMQQEQLKQQAIEKQKQDEMARAKTANAVLDHEIMAKETSYDIAQKVKTGEIHYNDAPNEFKKRVDQFPKFEPDINNPALAETYDKSVKRANFSAISEVNRTAQTAMQDDYKNQYGIALDKLGKLAGMPDADINQINQRAELLRPLAKQSSMDDAALGKSLQDFKDNNWFNNASQAVLTNSENMDNLKAMRKELTGKDGFYADKLDPNKRTALLKTVDGHIDQLTNSLQHAQDKQEALAERVIGEIDKQVSSTVPATAQQWADWSQKVKGTVYEADFKARVNDEQEVQSLLRKPIDEQTAYIQNKSQQMATNGGDLRAQANLKRLSTAVDANVKLLKEQPLIFNQNHTGQIVKPIDLNSIATDPSEITTQIQDRFTTVSALRKRYGSEVSLNPFLPQESDALKSVIAKADDNTKLSILGVLAKASPNAESYSSSLKAISADKGLLMAAGMAQFHGFKSSEGRDVAKTILAGEKILNDKSVIMPSEEGFKAAFEQNIGDAIPDGSPQREQAYSIFKAMYAGVANDIGVRHSNEDKNTADTKAAELALNLTTGGVSDYNDHKIIRPYGMAEDKFLNRIDTSLDAVAKNTGYAKGQIEDMPLIAVPGQTGMYYLMNGKKILPDRQGKPVMVNVK